MKPLIISGLIGIFLVLAMPFILSDRGDWLGPLERGMRAAFNGWDMWNTTAVRPYEVDAMPPYVEGTVPTRGLIEYEEGMRELAGVGPDGRPERAALVYSRYCNHCHGPHGDGRVIVGESFGFKLPDLRLDETQNKSDEELFDLAFDGSGNMIPLRHTVTPLDLLLAIEHIRSLKDAPSVPFFEPKYTDR